MGAVMEEKPEVHQALEPVILQAIHHIFTNSIMEFYEEAMSLSCDLFLIFLISLISFIF